MRARGLVILLLALFLSGSAVALLADPFLQPADVGERFVDVENYLFKIAQRNQWSLIIAKDVNSRLKEVQGKTVGDALKSYFTDTEFTWELRENCLYVAEKRRLVKFLEKLPEDVAMLPRGKNDVTLSGIFNSVEISTLFKILRNLTGVEVRSADGLRANMRLHLMKMPWKTLVVAIVRLNDFKMIRSEFSVIVASR
ncbi:MAG: hypothetical protein ACOYXC_13835 [Candidatus Rifleibacteriota bacterium]